MGEYTPGLLYRNLHSFPTNHQYDGLRAVDRSQGEIPAVHRQFSKKLIELRVWGVVQLGVSLSRNVMLKVNPKQRLGFKIETSGFQGVGWSCCSSSLFFG